MLQICMSMLCCSFLFLLACMHATNLHVNAMLFVCFFSTCMHACYKSACQCYVARLFLLAFMHATNLHVNAMLFVFFFLLACMHATNLHVNAMLFVFVFYLHACMLQTCMSMLCC